MKIFLISLISLVFITACEPKAIAIQGSYTDESGLDTIEVKQIDGQEYSIGNKLSQLKLNRNENTLTGHTPLGDSVKMVFEGDSAQYHIMGISTVYRKNLKWKIWF